MTWELASVGDIKIIDVDKVKAILNIATDLDAQVKAQTLKLQELDSAVLRIRELHYCNSCNCTDGACNGWCNECDNHEYPCDTIKALDGEQ